MRRQLSSLELRCVIRELRELVGLTVDKAYHFGGFNVLVRLKGQRKGAILISSGSFVIAGDADLPEGALPTSFAMLLRKHLSGARLVDVRQEGFDRIVRFTFSGAEGVRELVVELFGSGNVILLQDGVIVQPLTVRSWAKRTLKSQETYLPPPPPLDITQLTEEKTAEVLAGSKSDIVRTLASVAGLGGPFAEEACAIAGIEKSAKASQLTREEVAGLHKAVMGLLAAAETGAIEPYAIMSMENPTDFSPFRLRTHEGALERVFVTFGEAVQFYFDSHPRMADEGEETVAEERSATLERTIEQQRNAIARLETETAELEKKAEIVYTNYQYYNHIIERIKTVPLEDVSSMITGAKIVDARNHLYSIPSPEGGETILQKGKDINQNAGRLYEVAKKSRERLDGARRALEETMAKGAEQAKVHHEPKKAARRLFWFERFRWFVTSEGNLVIAGKDSKTNEQAVKKHLKEQDLYAHAEVHGAPSAILKALGPDGSPRDIGDSSRREACEFSLTFSKLWNAGLATGASYWVTPDQVSKTPNPGEYLAKGAFVIRGKRNYAQEIRVRCALGVLEYGGQSLAMCGPVTAVEANCAKYIVLDPGEVKKSDIAKEASKALGLPLDDIMQVMPPGNCRILSSKGVEMKAA
ncbi:MAG: ribosome rescue protein RqcH [Methanobacteriota archaeon]